MIKTIYIISFLLSINVLFAQSKVYYTGGKIYDLNNKKIPIGTNVKLVYDPTFETYKISYVNNQDLQIGMFFEFRKPQGREMLNNNIDKFQYYYYGKGYEIETFFVPPCNEPISKDRVRCGFICFKQSFNEGYEINGLKKSK